MSIMPNIFDLLKQKSLTKKERDNIDKTQEYLSNIKVVESMGTYNPHNIFRKGIDQIVNSKGELNSGRNLTYELLKIDDNNSFNETGRKINTSAGATEHYGTTTSYVVVPLEEKRNGKVAFENISNVHNASWTFDPKLVVLTSTYPEEIAAVARIARATELNDFTEQYCTINMASEPREITPRYFAGACEKVLRDNDLLPDEQQQQ